MFSLYVLINNFRGTKCLVGIAPECPHVATGPLQRIERNETVARKDVRFKLPLCCHYWTTY